MSQKSIISSIPGVVSQILITEGSHVTEGQELLILEAMKMENAIEATFSGLIKSIHVSQGQVVNKGDKLITIAEVQAQEGVAKTETDVEQSGTNRLIELRERKAFLADANRPKAVEKRDKKGQNTARKNIELLVDEDSFIEYGGLVVAAQRSRRSEQDLIENTPADGLVTGRGEVNGEESESKTSCLVMAYDYTVLAGTQGTMNHVKMDRVIAVAKEQKLPVVLFAEGGGGRPGDVDVQTIAGLYIGTFVEYASLRGFVPTVAIVEGYCFAGNAALAGSSDVIIATKSVSLGMGGPAMIEGGGIGKFHPKEVGPADVQTSNGVIDILCENEDEAIIAAKKYLSYWQGNLESWSAPDQTMLQDIIPNNRKRTFDVRKLMQSLFDVDSILELRPAYARGMITCFARVEGRPVGVLANDSAVDAGAITAANASKAAAFIDKCNDYNIPIVSLIDTPGIMVGPEAEDEGTVRQAGELFVSGAKFKMPFMSIVLRRAYGLGAMAMMGGGTRKSVFTISWPTGEFGAMGLEGAVKLGFRKEMEAISDPKEREQYYDKMVEQAYERGKALSMATMYEIDDVIEPKDTRSWILQAIKDL